MSINKINLLSEESFINQQDTENILLASIVQKQINNQSASYTPNSWANVDAMVDLGIAKTAIDIGDQFSCSRNNEVITWDVIGHNCDILSDSKYAGRDNMTLYMHNQLSTTMQFDAREAFYVADEEIPENTTCYILIESQPWYTADQGKYAQFTLTQGLPIGGQIVFTHSQDTTMFEKTLSTYDSANATTARETPTITEGSDGTKNLGTLKENLTQANVNSCRRSFWGSHNYKTSAIRQWLNSDAAAGNVWTPQTKFDRPPSWVNSANGFMYGMDEDFLKVVKKTHIKTARISSFEEDSLTYDEMDDYFFLLSKPQIYGGVTVSGVDEGQAYPYFKDYSTLNAAGAGDDSNRIKTRNNTANWYWLRSPDPWSAYYVRSVSATGSLGSGAAANGSGVAAACTI